MVKSVQKYCTVSRPKTKRVLAGRLAHSASHRQTVTKVRCSKNKNGNIKNSEGVNNNNFVEGSTTITLFDSMCWLCFVRVCVCDLEGSLCLAQQWYLNEACVFRIFCFAQKVYPSQKLNALVNLDKCILLWRKPEIKIWAELHASKPKALAKLDVLSSPFHWIYPYLFWLKCVTKVKF